MTYLAIVDSGVSNLTSVAAATERIDIETIVTSDPNIIQNASHVILPGVGAAEAAMNALQSKGLVETIQNLKQPLLGICLGMQLLFERSEESGGTETLGLIAGQVKLLPASKDEPMPHMGWNQIKLNQAEHPLLQGIEDDNYVYFVHSYAAPISEATIASSHYGTAFTAMVAHNNFMGCQFHPERSSILGQRILRNFIGM